ncbi:unnamed protein product [Camellia sinensis]
MQIDKEGIPTSAVSPLTHPSSISIVNSSFLLSPLSQANHDILSPPDPKTSLFLDPNPKSFMIFCAEGCKRIYAPRQRSSRSIVPTSTPDFGGVRKSRAPRKRNSRSSQPSFAHAYGKHKREYWIEDYYDNLSLFRLPLCHVFCAQSLSDG